MHAEKGPSADIEKAFEQLVAQYQTSLLRMCALWLEDDCAAEDATQETFFKAYQALPRFRGECSLKTWLMRIAVNVCRDMRRSAWLRRVDHRLTPEELSLPAENPATEDAQALAQAIRGLPPKYKNVVLLYYYQDMTLDETAQALGCSPSVVSRRLKHARECLRSVLEGGQNNA